MNRLFTLALIATVSAVNVVPAVASVSFELAKLGGKPDVVAGWGCVVIPGSGQWCGETGDDKIPDEK